MGGAMRHKACQIGRLLADKGNMETWKRIPAMGIENDMIKREDILSMEYLKKTEYTGCHEGMRYRLEGIKKEDGEKVLICTVWPEPFNFLNTPDSEKERAEFLFAEDGVCDAIAWMNDRLFEEKDRWDHACEHWDNYG